jgi:AcrR family transcriptional regulator
MCFSLVSEYLLTSVKDKDVNMIELSKRQMQIVTAAIKVIAEMGYEKLTTKNLAREVGVTDAALYKHFDSKKELIRMILCYFEQVSCSIIEKLCNSDLSGLDRIRGFVMNRYEIFCEEPDLAMVMFSEELFRNEPSFEENLLSIMHIHRDVVLGFIIKGQQEHEIHPDLNPMNTFRMVVGSMRLLVSQWNMSRHAFDLKAEGKALIEEIIKLIEVPKC